MFYMRLFCYFTITFFLSGCIFTVSEDSIDLSTLDSAPPFDTPMLLVTEGGAAAESYERTGRYKGLDIVLITEAKNKFFVIFPAESSTMSEASGSQILGFGSFPEYNMNYAAFNDSENKYSIIFFRNSQDYIFTSFSGVNDFADKLGIKIYNNEYAVPDSTSLRDIASEYNEINAEPSGKYRKIFGDENVDAFLSEHRESIFYE